MIERPERARQIRDLLADFPAGAFLGPAYWLFVVYAGATAWPLAERVEALPIGQLFERAAEFR